MGHHGDDLRMNDKLYFGGNFYLFVAIATNVHTGMECTQACRIKVRSAYSCHKEGIFVKDYVFIL